MVRARWAWRHRLLISFLITTCVFATEFALLKIPKVQAAYTIASSTRFDAASVPTLSRTPSSAGNRRTFTTSFWMKPSSMDSSAWRILWGAGDGNTSASSYLFYKQKKKGFFFLGGGGAPLALAPTR